MAIDRLKHQIIAVSVSSTLSSQNDGKGVRSGSKELRFRRIAKRKHFLYQHMNQRELHAEIAKDVNAFYNNIVPFVLLFPSDLYIPPGFLFLPWLTGIQMIFRVKRKDLSEIERKELYLIF